MTRDWSKIFLGALVLMFCAEHLWLVTRPSPPTIDGPTCIVKLVKS